MTKKKSPTSSAKIPLKDVVSQQPQAIQENTSVHDATETLRSLNTETMPVASGATVVGRTRSKSPDQDAARFGHDPATAQVRDQMSAEILYCFADEPQEAAIKLMRERKISHLPVVDRDLQIIGIVSLNRLVADISKGARGPAKKSKLAKAQKS